MKKGRQDRIAETLTILQGCFPRSEDLRIFSMLRLQYVLLVFYETHKKTKGRIEKSCLFYLLV